ncbi:MAG: peptidylprolyl isomerase [Pseudomonadota bacterium]
MTSLFERLVLCAVALLMATAAQAQNRFAPIIQVGDSVVTRYELDQRTRFLALLNAPGDPRNIAREQLINEAVQLTAARDLGIVPSPEAIEAGLQEFAGRANLTAEEFTQALGQNGVDAETFRDFVTAGVAWREYSRARFAQPARDIPRVQIERTLAQTGTEGGLRVLVSEILLPATTPETTRASRQRAVELSQITSEAAFATAARQFSVAGSRANGGELDWVALESLPEATRGIIAGLTPGQISRPVPLENAIGVFLLRDAERAEAGTPENLQVDYALFLAGGTRSDTERIAARIDTCDDLYGEADGLPAERLIREQVAVDRLPADVRQAVASLDIGDTSTALKRSGQATVLMLCGRRASLESDVDFDLVANRLLNNRIGVIAADHLADLRANTFVVDLTN